MDMYYCRFPIRICVTATEIEKIINSLSRNNYRISFVLNEEDYRSVIYLIIKDVTNNREETWDIDVMYRQESSMAAMAAIDDSDYILRFTLTSDYFKTLINKIRAHSDVFNIQCTSGNDLQITFDKTKKVGFGGSLGNDPGLELVWTGAPDDILIVKLFVAHVHPLAKNAIGDNVRVAVDSTRRISFTTGLDRKEASGAYAVDIKIFTEIKDCRGNNTE
jgi:hypothetical protein